MQKYKQSIFQTNNSPLFDKIQTNNSPFFDKIQTNNSPLFDKIQTNNLYYTRVSALTLRRVL